MMTPTTRHHDVARRVGPARHVVLLILAVVHARQAAASANLPATRPAAHLVAFLDACNRDDATALSSFASHHLSRAFLARTSAEEYGRRQANGFCRDTGGLDVRQILVSTPAQLEVLAQARVTEDWFRFRLEVAVDRPDTLALFHTFPAVPPESATQLGLTDAQIVRDLKSYMDALGASGRFQGVVLLAKGGTPIFQGAYGAADVASNRRNSMNTMFTIGSVQKMFTAIAVGQLVERGRMSFQDTVGEFLPDYPSRQVREKVTIGELLSHTSGLGDFLAARSEFLMRHGVKRAADYLPLFWNDPPLFEPGSGWSYSNAGFALVGAIVEKVSGESYFDYIRNHVFAPAGMTSSDANETPRVLPQMATPYGRRDGGKWNDREPVERDLGSPAGGSYTTALDMLRFSRALLEDKLLSRNVRDQLFVPHATTPQGTQYGYGFEIFATRENRRAVGHGGGFPGVDALIELYVDQDYTLIELANADTNIALGKRLRTMLLGR
jgi:CubicO group peptidase (beta-lactamase class C family)